MSAFLVLPRHGAGGVLAARRRRTRTARFETRYRGPSARAVLVDVRTRRRADARPRPRGTGPVAARGPRLCRLAAAPRSVNAGVGRERVTCNLPVCTGSCGPMLQFRPAHGIGTVPRYLLSPHHLAYDILFVTVGLLHRHRCRCFRRDGRSSAVYQTRPLRRLVVVHMRMKFVHLHVTDRVCAACG